MQLSSQWIGNVAIGAAILALYLWIGSVLARRKAPPRAWCIPLIFLLCTTYLYGLRVSGSVVYGGLTGDGSFEIAYIRNAAAGNLLGDAYTKTVPADYSLLYFWILGLISRLSGMEAITVWQLAPLVALIAAPLLVYGIGAQLGDADTGFWSCVAFFGLGALHMQFFLTSDRRWGTYNLMLIKPHEVLALLLLLSWFVSLARRAAAREAGWRSVLISGLLGALLVLTYYPLFVLGLAAVAVHALVERDAPIRRALLLHAASFAVLGLVLSAPGWFTYVSALATQPHDPMYRGAFLVLWNLDPTMYTFGMGYLGSVFLLGLVALKDFASDARLRLLLIFVAGCYVMILATFILYPLAGLSFLPQKWSELLLVTLGVLAGRGLQLLMRRLSKPPAPLLVFTLLLLFIPSPLTWNRLTDADLSYTARDRTLLSIAGGITRACQPVVDDQSFTVLATPSLAYTLPTVSQWRLYLAPNIHYATPLALHRQHAQDVAQLAEARSSDDLEGRLQSMGVNLLVLEKREGEFLLSVDTEPRSQDLLSGASRQALVVRLAPQLPAGQGFSRVYEDGQFIAFLIPSGAPACTPAD